MKVILVFVSTLNGRITRGDDPEVRHWSSDSDKEHYARVWNDAKQVVMGSTTWKENVIKTSPGKLILVMTGKPGEYKGHEIPGQLEFTSSSPSEIVARFKKAGNDTVTVVGGPAIATSFLKAGLVDELWLTIEPRLFGKGINLVSESDIDVRLKTDRSC